MDFRHQTGLSAELYTASYFAAQGYDVFWPMQTQSRADFLVFKDDKYIKVQCKKATWSKTGTYKYLQCRLTNRNKGAKPKYTAEDFDVLVMTDLESIWVTDFSEISELTSVCLASTKENYKPQTKYDSRKWKVK